MDRMGPSVRVQLWDAISFSLAAPVVSRLGALFNGRVVYQRHWQDFLVEMRDNWTRMSQLVSLNKFIGLQLRLTRILGWIPFDV
jgi:hypothetical protein